jgi:hypothetical protein
LYSNLNRWGGKDNEIFVFHGCVGIIKPYFDCKFLVFLLSKLFLTHFAIETGW